MRASLLLHYPSSAHPFTPAGPHTTSITQGLRFTDSVAHCPPLACQPTLYPPIKAHFHPRAGPTPTPGQTLFPLNSPESQSQNPKGQPSVVLINQRSGAPDDRPFLNSSWHLLSPLPSSPLSLQQFRLGLASRPFLLSARTDADALPLLPASSSARSSR